MKLCNDELNIGCLNCCLTIVYYERYALQGPNANFKDYQSNVVGILWDGSNCPCDLNLDDIMIKYENVLFKTKSQEQKGFWIKKKKTPDNETDDAYLNSQSPFSHNFYVSGGCYQKDSNGELIRDSKGFPVECNPGDVYCCRKTQWVTTYGLTGIIQEIHATNPQGNLIQENSNQNHQNCPTLCLSKCNDPLYDELDHYECFLPENCTKYDKDKISNDNEEIFCNLIPNDCPDCCFTVTYDYRVTKGCVPKEYHDFSIDKVSYSPQCNNNCQVSIDVLFDAVIDALLTISTKAPKPEMGSCEINYRFYQNSCWFDHYYEQTGYRTITRCSKEFNCCFRQYEVCASNSTPIVYTSRQIGASIPVDKDYCDNVINPYPCYFLCGEPQQNSIQIIEEINEYHFKVLQSEDNILINTNKSEKTNLNLEIYDFNGNLIKKEIIENNKYHYYLDNINNLKYIFVLIKENGKVVYSGKFIK